MSFTAPSKDSQLGFLIGAVTGVAAAYCITTLSSKAKPSHVKLYYFDGRGLAEVPRTLLALAGVKPEEERYSVHKNEEGKFVKPEMEADAKKGLFDSNMGRVPILEVKVGGKTVRIGQAKTIARYIAHTWGLNGGCAVESARIDAICECIFDLKDAFNKQTDKEKWFNGTDTDQGDRQLMFYLQAIEKLVEGNGFSVGNSATLADAWIYNTLGDTAETKGLFGSPNSEPMNNGKAVTEALEKYSPKLAKIVKTFQALPAIQTYLGERPQGLF